MSRFDPARLAKLDARMGEWVAEGKYERLEWMLGHASGPTHRGATGDSSIYRIYSMTKPIVSVAALQLIEEGRLQLFHPVSLYLPEYADVMKRTERGVRRIEGRMTIHHLITHTAGLSYGFLTDGPGLRLNALNVHGAPLRSLRDEAAEIAKAPLGFEPGTEWRYSVATDVLAAVLEVIEGRPLAEILKTRIFDPLEMTETSFRPGAAAADRIAPIQGGLPGLLDAKTVPKTYPHDDPDFARGGHGLFSTLEDYGRFALSLLQTARGVRAHGFWGARPCSTPCRTMSRH